MSQSGGRFDFDDGGIYCGAWEDGKAHGQGICTGPKGQGEYAGSWNHGFEVLGIYTWPSGNTYEGNWSMGKRHNLGVEVRGKWEYKGEWAHGYKGRYGVRSNLTSRAKYEGGWNKGLQDGHGKETYTDGGAYQGQWVDGKRHGHGVRISVPYGLATMMRGSWKESMNSLRSEMSNGTSVAANATNEEAGDANSWSRAGFVLSRRPVLGAQTPAPLKRNRLFRSSSTSLGRSLMGGLKVRTRSNLSIASGNSIKSSQSMGTTGSLTSATSDYNSIYDPNEMASRLETIEDEVNPDTTETYYGEWKNDTRSGYGVCKQTPGLLYEGEWFNNQRHGYGRTTFPDGTKEEGKYKFNVISAGTKKNFPLKSNRLKARVLEAVESAQKAKKCANQKSEIALSKAAHSGAKASQADVVAQNAREEAYIARCVARDQDPSFKQPGLEYIKQRSNIYRTEATVKDPFLAETERRDVQGPESYLQYSQQNANAASAERVGDVNENSSSPQTLLPHKEIATQRNEQRVRVNAFHQQKSLEENRALSNNPQMQQRLQQLPPGASHSVNVSEEEKSKENLRAQARLNHNASAPLTRSSSFSNNRKREEISSASAMLNSPGPRHKKGFFRSLRIRSRKTPSNDSGQTDGVSERNREKENKKLKNQSAVGPRWPANSAQTRRKEFQKAYTKSERASCSFGSRSFDLGSFDYQSNQDLYLQSYESEMKGAENEKNILDQDVLVPSTANPSYQTRLAPSKNPSLYVTAERLDVPHANDVSTFDNQFQRPQPHGGVVRLDGIRRPVDDDSKQSQNFTQLEGGGSGRKISRLSVAPLRPRDVDQITTMEFQPPTPAFATYSGPASVKAPVESSDSPRPVRKSVHLGNSFEEEHDGAYGDYSHQNEFFHSGTLPSHTNTDYSPLPSKLRRRTTGSNAPSSEFESVNTKSDGEVGGLYVSVLVILLIVGFMAVFVQVIS